MKAIVISVLAASLLLEVTAAWSTAPMLTPAQHAKETCMVKRAALATRANPIRTQKDAVVRKAVAARAHRAAWAKATSRAKAETLHRHRH